MFLCFYLKVKFSPKLKYLIPVNVSIFFFFNFDKLHFYTVWRVFLYKTDGSLDSATECELNSIVQLRLFPTLLKAASANKLVNEHKNATIIY